MRTPPRLVVMNIGFTGDCSILMISHASTGGTCFGDSDGPAFFGGVDSN